MRIPLTKKEKDNLWFILYEFIDTHNANDIYIEEIKIADKIIKLMKMKAHTDLGNQ